MIKKEILYKILILLSSVMLFFNDIYMIVLLLLFLNVIFVFYARKDIKHPFIFITPLITLYYIAYPILIKMNIYEFNLIAIIESLKLSFLSFLIISFFCLNRKYKENYNLDKYFIFLKIGSKLSAMFEVILVGLMLFVYLKGYSSKTYITLYIPFVKKFYFMLDWYLIYSYIRIIYEIKIKQRYRYLSIYIVVITFIMFILGERDIFFKGIIGLIMIYNSFIKKIKLRKIIILGSFVFFVILPNSNSLKSFFSEKKVVNEKKFIVKILESDFSAASKNFARIVNLYRNNELVLLNGETILWDVDRAFFPKKLSYFKTNPSKWFNETYNPNLSKLGMSQGFSLLGEGYMNFTKFGVVGVSVILGFIIKKIYYESNKNLIGFIIYIPFTNLLVYITRGDFSYLLAQSVKLIILPIILILIIEFILKNRMNRYFIENGR